MMCKVWRQDLKNWKDVSASHPRMADYIMEGRVIRFGLEIYNDSKPTDEEINAAHLMAEGSAE